MPHYKQKILTPMSYPQFIKTANQEQDPLKRAFLEILYWSTRRLAEVMPITQEDIYSTEDTIFITFWHLKKGTYRKGKRKGESKNRRHIQQLPRNSYLEIILSQEGRIFPYSNKWGYRTVKAIFPRLYPHYFRGNMLTQISIQFGDAFARQVGDITPEAQKAYSLDVDLGKVYAWQRSQTRVGVLRGV